MDLPFSVSGEGVFRCNTTTFSLFYLEVVEEGSYSLVAFQNVIIAFVCVDAFFVILVVHACCSGDYKPWPRRKESRSVPQNVELYKELPLFPEGRKIKATFPHEEEKDSMFFEEEKAGKSFALPPQSPDLIYHEAEYPASVSSKSARLFSEHHTRSKKNSA